MLFASIEPIQTPEAHYVIEKYSEDFYRIAFSYQAAMERYLGSEEGQEEFEYKNQLREDYLSCDASDDQIISYLTECGPEVQRRLSEWSHKCSLGLLEKQDPTISLDELREMAALYALIHDQVQSLDIFQEYVQAHAQFKAEVIELLNNGSSPFNILQSLKDSGITNERLLSRPGYWAKKDL